MAAIVSALYSLFCEKLASETFKQFARFRKIDPDVENLKGSLTQIKDLLNDASKKEISQDGVKAWVNSLQDMAFEIDDLLDELATEAIHREFTEESGATPSKVRRLNMQTMVANLSENARMHDKLEKITTKLQQLLAEKNILGLSVIGESPKPRNRRLQTSVVDASSIVGRTVEKEALLLKLFEPCERNFGIVPIVGMGGVGKTTLARLLYNEEKVKDHFELKAWVCVSDEFDIINISKTILQSVCGGKQNLDDLNLLQVALQEKISKKRFLIVLDDVWSESYAEWEILARPFLAGAPGSKVIITTRKQSLLTQLGYKDPYCLSILSPDSALSLFCQHALGENNFDSNPALRPHGEGIIGKCNGLPLALIALGRLLRTRLIDEEEWKGVLNSEIWKLEERDEISPALRLSYYDLPSSLKRLFAYCSLFPKDYLFDKEELVLLWMAEGFLNGSTTDMSMEPLGREYFIELCSRSFFQRAPNDESLFVMHDLMNDLAESVAGDFFSRSDIKMKKELRKEALGMYRHMSIVCERYMVHEWFKAFKGAKNMRTFLALSNASLGTWDRFYLSNKILANLLHELPLLRVLSLSNLGITEVPEVIGSLKHLRYLNLSRTNIKHLPENVCNLYNLQTLILFGCKSLTMLSNSFLKLKNLRHLDIRDTPNLRKMPLGIGELKDLQILSKIIIGGENGFPIADLKNLQNLRGKISIWGLGNVQYAMDACNANLSQKSFSELELDWGYGLTEKRVRKEPHDKDVLNELNPHNDSLKKLKIVSYGGTEFPNWVGDPLFLGLTHVSIYNCEECTSLPRLGQLPSLKELFISGMSKVKLIGLELLGTHSPFPSLEILSFRLMSGWEAWSTNNSGVVGAAFPRLQELRIQSCPNLIQVSLETLPSLRFLIITGCGHVVLRSLVNVASSVTKLEIHNISGLTDDLWRGVSKNLGEVEEVSIRGCNEISYLWESEAEASKFPVRVRNLEVNNCSNLLSLGETEEDNRGSNLTSLTGLQILHCKRLEHCSCPENIESLSIKNCDSLTSVSFPTGGGHKLKSLSIYGWPNLKSVMELSHFIHLNRLSIEECPRLESFPDHELPNLTSLTYLKITECPSMDSSFPGGCWPPKLCILEIGGLKKPISEWGPQNFPPSLVHLWLGGGSSEGVRNFCQLSHIFPSSLISLSIWNFEKLESLSKGLHRLTSLQHLFIVNCPKTMDLPETLLPSLLTLRIYDCPNLKERSSRRDLYWPIISHVPCFEIDFESQN